jgi:hypothetical protein
MKRSTQVLKVLGLVLLAIMLLAVAGVAGADLWAQQRTQELRTRMKADLDEHSAAMLADHALMLAHPAFAPRAGNRDAGAFLNSRVGWTASPAPSGALGLPAALESAVKGWNTEWHTHVDDVDLTGVDLAWMKDLASFDFWDIEENTALGNMRPFFPVDAPLPEFTALLQAARVRLLQGLKLNQARAASAEVLDLARLCLSTENLVGEMVGLAMLRMDARARQVAVERRQDVTGWLALDAPDLQRFKRGLWAVSAFFGPVAPDGYPLTGDVARKVAVGRCAGMMEGMGQALMTRSLLLPRHAARYQELGNALKDSPCRLKQLRRVWNAVDHEGELPTDGRMFCAAGGAGPAATADCGVPDAVVHFPFLRSFVGEVMLSIASPDWTRHHRESPSP